MTDPGENSIAAQDSDNIAVVDGYLQLCEDREGEKASRVLHPEIRMEFPGGVVYRSLSDLFSASSSDYQWVRKRRTRYFEGKSSEGDIVVSMGMLYGVDLDGNPFDNIRYVDTFVLENSLIKEQLVWNDLAKSGIGQIANKEKEDK